MGRIARRQSRGAGRRVWAAATVLFVSLAPAFGCYHYRAQVPDVAGAASTEYAGEVVWSLAWGLLQETPRIDNCHGQALAEVRVTSNFGFALLTVASVGLASPAKVEWRCAKPTVQPGVIRLPGDSANRR